MNHTNTKMVVATTILQQLGGNKFIAMTGAKDLVGQTNSLMFKLPTGFAKDRINFVQIKLMPDDTYTMQFHIASMDNIRKGKPFLEKIQEYTDVYWDQLQELFTEATGLYTHL